MSDRHILVPRCSRLFFLLCLLSLISLPLPQAAAAAETSSFDPAHWGAYAQLIGTEWKKGAAGSVSWRAAPDSEAIIERLVDDLSPWETRITRGAEPGTLIYHWSSAARWEGRITADGSVVWKRGGWAGRVADLAFRVGMDGDMLRWEDVKLKDGEVVAVEQRHPYVLAGSMPTATNKTVAIAPGAASTLIQQREAAARKPSDDLPVDATWGIYADMVGREWQSARLIRVRWIEPGRELLEEWHNRDIANGTAAEVVQTTRISLGDKPGKLIIRTERGGKTFPYVGTVKANGDLRVSEAGLLGARVYTLSRESGDIVAYEGLIADRMVANTRFFALPRAGTPAMDARPWGDLASMAGKRYYFDMGAGGEFISFRWFVPGFVMYVSRRALGNDNEISLVIEREGGAGLVANYVVPFDGKAKGSAASDGEVSFKLSALLFKQDWSYKLDNGRLNYFFNATLADNPLKVSGREVADSEVPGLLAKGREEYERAEQARLEREARQAEREAAENAATAAAIMQGLQTFSSEMSKVQLATPPPIYRAPVPAASSTTVSRSPAPAIPAQPSVSSLAGEKVTRYTPVHTGAPATGNWASAGAPRSSASASPGFASAASTTDNGVSAAGSSKTMGQASIASDPTTCVAPPVFGTNTSCPTKQQAAHIRNGCAEPVDARLCLKVAGQWKCSANYGIKSGQSWSFGFCEQAADDVFFSVRNSSDHKTRLSSP